jgi:hypothetical protein
MVNVKAVVRVLSVTIVLGVFLEARIFRSAISSRPLSIVERDEIKRSYLNW